MCLITNRSELCLDSYIYINHSSNTTRRSSAPSGADRFYQAEVGRTNDGSPTRQTCWTAHARGACEAKRSAMRPRRTDTRALESGGHERVHPRSNGAALRATWHDVGPQLRMTRSGPDQVARRQAGRDLTAAGFLSMQHVRLASLNFSQA